jgi:hypothetical protein
MYVYNLHCTVHIKYERKFTFLALLIGRPSDFTEPWYSGIEPQIVNFALILKGLFHEID